MNESGAGWNHTIGLRLAVAVFTVGSTVGSPVGELSADGLSSDGFLRRESSALKASSHWFGLRVQGVMASVRDSGDNHQEEA